MTREKSWSSPADLRAELIRHWDNGHLLRVALAGEQAFPLRLRLRGPSTSDLSERFDEVRTWIKALEEASRSTRGFGYVVEWEERNLRRLGLNRVPVSINVPSEQDALRLIGKERQMARFRALVAETLTTFPELETWLMKRPLTALEREADWSLILAVLSWFRAHPKASVYVRQIDVPRVDTKFIELHKGVLAELLDQVLHPDAIDASSVGARNFERRYGLRTKPAQVRFRLLDPELCLQGMSDIAIPASEFAKLRLPVERVFITENEVNGLAFPAASRSIVIFGLGYGLERLAEAAWLKNVQLHYWGDLDTHGFWMLDRLRTQLPHARSLLMDRETLVTHRHAWVREGEPARFAPNHLEPEEHTLYDDLVHDRLGQAVRLEQERIGFRWLESALQALR
ncbi:MAG: DUF3322 domain-containing protein [Myxococcota bacterium]